MIRGENMSDVIIDKSSIISSGISNWDHEYIVYADAEGVKVNTDFESIGGGKVKCCPLYERVLCKTIGEFRKLPIEVVKETAYQAWMDGAHS